MFNEIVWEEIAILQKEGSFKSRGMVEGGEAGLRLQHLHASEDNSEDNFWWNKPFLGV